MELKLTFNGKKAIVTFSNDKWFEKQKYKNLHDARSAMEVYFDRWIANPSENSLHVSCSTATRALYLNKYFN